MQLRTTTCSLAVSAAFAAFIPFNAAAAPTIAFTAPAVGGVLKGNVQGPPNCIVEGADVARVMFYINDVWTNTDGNLTNGLGCWIDTTKYKDGAYTLKAVAYNAAGQTATATRAITIQNTVAAPAPAPTPTSGAPTVAVPAPAAADRSVAPARCRRRYQGQRAGPAELPPAPPRRSSRHVLHQRRVDQHRRQPDQRSGLLDRHHQVQGWRVHAEGRGVQRGRADDD